MAFFFLFLFLNLTKPPVAAAGCAPRPAPSSSPAGTTIPSSARANSENRGQVTLSFFVVPPLWPGGGSTCPFSFVFRPAGRQRAGARRPGGAAGPRPRRSRSRELPPVLPEERRSDIVYGAASPERGVKLCTCSPHAN